MIELTLVGHASADSRERGAARAFEQRFTATLPPHVLVTAISDASHAFRGYSQRAPSRKHGFFPLSDRRSPFVHLAEWLTDAGRTDLLHAFPRLYFRTAELLTSYEHWTDNTAEQPSAPRSFTGG